MATALKPRAVRNPTPPLVNTVLNACEIPANDMPDVTFEAEVKVRGALAKVTYSIRPRADAGDDKYLALYAHPDERRSYRVLVEEGGIEPEDLRAMATLLAAVADEVEKSLEHHLLRIRRAYDTIDGVLEELYAEEQPVSLMR